MSKRLPLKKSIMPVKSGEEAPIGHYSEIYRRLFATKYHITQYTFVEFFAEHLADLSRVFEADLASVIILATVGQMELKARIRSQYYRPGELPDEARVGAPARINASSIAEFSGIPRETVRRKLDVLARRGWIARDEDGLWHIKTEGPNMAPVRKELVELDVRAQERVSRFLGAMHTLAVAETKASAASSWEDGSEAEPTAPPEPRAPSKLP